MFSVGAPENQPKAWITMMQHAVTAGFRVLAIDFGSMVSAYPNLLADDAWEQHIDALAETASAMQAEFVQANLPFHDDLLVYGRCPDAQSIAHLQEMIRRSILACARLGIKWAVVRPLTDTVNGEFDNTVNLASNHAFYEQYVTLAEQSGVGLAFENMPEFSLTETMRRYCSTPEELIDLVDSFGSDAVGICWDFGHAHSILRDHPAALRLIGSRLKAVHARDNKPTVDAHLIPFIGGNIKWEVLMPVLTEIGYTGDFVLDACDYMRNIPQALRPSAAKLAYELSMHCLSFAESGEN